MSLVNDMLRDLDRRRKETSGGGATSSLTPVPETIPEKAQQPVYIYLALAVLLGGAAATWFWLQQDNAESTRQLEITPNVVIQPTNTTPVAPAATSALEERRTGIALASNAAVADTTTNSLTDQQDSLVSDTARSQAMETAVNTTIPDSAEEAIDFNINDDFQAPVPEPQESSSIGVSRENQLIANNSTANSESAASAVVDLTAPPNAEVKSDAVLSPEERDVLAVQEALRLIADNQLTGAYQILEQQVIDNRYAHQSRETYAKLLLNEGNLRGAYELVESGLGLSGNHTGFKKIKARILIASGELEEAVTLLITRAPEVARDLEYHDILATAQLASRDYQGALISYTELVQQDQSQGKWWYGFAASQDLLGNSNAARQGYSQAVSLPNLSASLRRRSQERLASLD